MIILTPDFAISNQCQVATFHLKKFASINKIAICIFLEWISVQSQNLAITNFVDKESYSNANLLLTSQDVIPISWQMFLMSITYFLRLVWLYIRNFLLRIFQYYFTWSEDPFPKRRCLHYQRHMEKPFFF